MRPILFALLLAAAPAFAQQPAPAPASPPAAPGATQPRQPSPAQAAQQQRMRDCNATAGQRQLKGEDRRKFMSDCLAGRVPATEPPAAAAPLTPQQAQQQRMRDCNAEAATRGLAGDARRGFMSECLAGRMPPRP